MLNFNLKDANNPELRLNVLLKKITIKQLLKSNSNDLASSRLKSIRRKNYEKHFSEQVEIKDNKLILLKNHKGEEIINTDNIQNKEVNVSFKNVDDID